jgi:hypothetical protein
VDSRFRKNDERGFDLKSPATAPVLLSFMGVFGKRLFEPNDFIGEFPLDAHETQQNRNQAVGGSLFFGFFLLAKQKKETRPSRESDHLHTALFLSVTTLG